MLKDKIIRPSNCQFSSSVVLIQKPDKAFCFCVDYRKINKITVKDAFPLPQTDETIDQITQAKCISKIDLQTGYSQIKIIREDKNKTFL